MLKIGSAVDKTTRALSLVTYATCLAIMILNVVDVVLTKFFSAPVRGAYELTESLMLCTVFSSFAYAQSKKTHINMSLVVSHLPRPLKFSIYALMGLISTAIAGIVCWAAVVQAQASAAKGVVTDVLALPKFPLYYFEAFCMLVFALALLYDALLALWAIWDDACAEKVTESWT